MKENAFERVLTVHEWWDCPRAGVAHFHGEPHIYICTWDDAADDWSEVYSLTPVDPRTLELLLEDYEIWRRWLLAFDAGKVARESGPALPQDSARALELKKELKSVFDGSATPIARVRPEFRRRADADRTRDPYNMEVHWQVLP